MDRTRVSVIATVRNEAREIEPLVSSLMRQTLAPADVVIVDGASEDGTWSALLSAAAKWPALRPIQDETCQRSKSAGPIARGRNVAIESAHADVIACVDGGCVYREDWLERLTLPIRNGQAEYALGGSCLEAEATVWDWAAAPFFGIKPDQDAPTKSCTARSVAFTRDLWKRVGGFPETTALAEDTLFDERARTLAKPAFVRAAKAIYRPRRDLRSALFTLGNYAKYDGILKVRPARLGRGAMRCAAQVFALLMLHWSVWPLFGVLTLELWIAFGPDARALFARPPTAWLARVAFSLLVPWVVTGCMLFGRFAGGEVVPQQTSSVD